jgi:hypothetical protein
MYLQDGHNQQDTFLLFLNSILQCIGIKITTRILLHMIKINIYLNMKNLHILSIINIWPYALLAVNKFTY